VDGGNTLLTRKYVTIICTIICTRCHERVGTTREYKKSAYFGKRVCQFVKTCYNSRRIKCACSAVRVNCAVNSIHVPVHSYWQRHLILPTAGNGTGNAALDVVPSGWNAEGGLALCIHKPRREYGEKENSHLARILHAASIKARIDESCLATTHGTSVRCPVRAMIT